MLTGTLKWFNSAKGFGFIQPEDGGKDVFVHISAFERANLHSFAEGLRLYYEIEKGKDGRVSAANLALLE
jgi:CspA family cold shock protein